MGKIPQAQGGVGVEFVGVGGAWQSRSGIGWGGVGWVWLGVGSVTNNLVNGS